MLKAADVMTREVITTTPDVMLDSIINRLVESKVSGMPVCDEQGGVIGIITERDILNYVFSGNLSSTTVGDAMSRQITSFPPDADIDKISLTMGEKMIRRVPIIDEGKLVGIISRRSIIRTVLGIPGNGAAK